MNNLEKLKFPIGLYAPNKSPDRVLLDAWINDIAAFPVRIEASISGATKEQLNWRYRADGWTVKQVIHHCADSHMNSFIRFKLALTEEKPTIRPYYEDRWALLVDGQDDDVQDSIQLLKALHKKWVKLLQSLSMEQLNLEYIHPEHGAVFNLAETIGNYAWHCNHHLAHVENGLASEGLYY